MAGEFGNPQRPCADIERSKALLDTISRSARENAERGTADATEVEVGITDLRREVAQNLGMVCGQICGSQNRCMLESFGADDPLLKKASLSPPEQQELGAKRQYDELRALAEMSMGIFLG